MKKKSYMFVIPLLFLLMLSLVCLAMLLVPETDKQIVYQIWLFWWNIYYLGLILTLCISFLILLLKRS